MDIEAFKGWCLDSFDEEYLKKLKGERRITMLDYVHDKKIMDALNEFLKNRGNMQPNEVAIDRIIEADLFLGADKPAIVDEGKIIGLLTSLGYEMGDDHAMY